MAQEEPPEIKELRSDMRKGHLPLIDAIRSAYKPHRIAFVNSGFGPSMLILTYLSGATESG